MASPSNASTTAITALGLMSGASITHSHRIFRAATHTRSWGAFVDVATATSISSLLIEESQAVKRAAPPASAS
jgi:hypothetical protein